MAGLPAAVEVGDGRDQTFALTANGDVWAWGNNADGQLGDGSTTRRTSPVKLAITGVTVVQAGAKHAVFFVGASSPPPNQAPSASFTYDCDAGACSFDGGASRDPDGEIEAYAWEFGDGSVASGSTGLHLYAANGTYDVTLQVTDDDGVPGTTTLPVTVVVDPVPPTGSITYRTGTTTRVNASTVSADIPSAALSGDTLLLFVTGNRSGIQLRATTAGWTLLDSVTDATMTTAVFAGVAPGGPSTVTVSAGQRTKLDAQLLAYGGTDSQSPVAAVALRAEPGNTAEHTTPTVSAPSGMVVSYWADKTSTTTSWSAPTSLVPRLESVGSGGGRITSLTADSGVVQPAGSVGGEPATASSANSKATMVTVVLRPS